MAQIPKHISALRRYALKQSWKVSHCEVITFIIVQVAADFEMKRFEVASLPQSALLALFQGDTSWKDSQFKDVFKACKDKTTGGENVEMWGKVRGIEINNAFKPAWTDFSVHL